MDGSLTWAPVGNPKEGSRNEPHNWADVRALRPAPLPKVRVLPIPDSYYH